MVSAYLACIMVLMYLLLEVNSVCEVKAPSHHYSQW